MEDGSNGRPRLAPGSRGRGAAPSLPDEIRRPLQLTKPFCGRESERIPDRRVMGPIDFSKGNGELEATRVHDRPERLVARPDFIAFPSPDDGGWLPCPLRDLGLGKAGAAPGFLDQVAGDHLVSITANMRSEVATRA